MRASAEAQVVRQHQSIFHVIFTALATKARFMRFLLGSILVCVACSSTLPRESDDPPRVQDPIPVPAFRIEPANPILVSGGTFQFRAVDSSGTAVPVYWRLADAQIGSISATGVLAPCYGGGQTQIRALAQADTTKAASTAVTIEQPLFAIVSIASLSYALNSTVVKLDSVAGTIDVTVNIAAGALTCKQVIGSRLELLGAGSTSRVDSIRFFPIPTANLTHTFHWSTTSFLNGAYTLRSLLIFPTYEYAGNEIPIIVRNP